ncbi:PQQ-dependent sugar dehydrogenase [bacterium]|nr:PQQ-dependent sugar dehydrogenase [bacterium]
MSRIAPDVRRPRRLRVFVSRAGVLGACVLGALLGGAPLLPLAAAPATACPDVVLTIEPIADGLTKPVRLVAPDGDERLFIVQQNGLVTVHDRDGTSRGTFLDLTGQTAANGERGLLGLAFAPDYAASGRCYVNYTDASGDTRIVRYTVSAGDPDALDAGSAELLLTIDQPAGNHNGGHLEFAPDGMLIMATGDGGGAGDTSNNAQTLSVPLGKLLRLDVSPATGYAVPADNPFLGTAGAELVWTYGLRNPWCFSFDSGTGDLYIADVGQGQWEEVDIVPAGTAGGRNFGWRVTEGTHCYNPSSGCDATGHTLPVYEYSHGGSPFRCSISGGYVYRGAEIPDLQGTYFFSDFCSNQIWTMRWTLSGGLSPVSDCSDDLTPTGGYGGVSGFGRDGLGELYILDHGNGAVYRIVQKIAASPLPAGPTGRLDAAPNPFHGRTEFSYTVARGRGPVTVDVHDLRGRLVRTIVDEPQPEGARLATWDGHDAAGRRLPAGTYLCRMRQGETVAVTKVTLVD